MEAIIIRQKEETDSGFKATVQFGHEGVPYDIQVSDPFSPEEEKILEWYFERWLSFPFTDKVRAQTAAKSVRIYGENLFNQVFRTHPEVFMEYQQYRGNARLEIAGNPEFHRLHWEAMHDPNQERPLSVDIPVVRKKSKPTVYRAKVQAADRLRVLLVTARPGGKNDVKYRTISRPLVETLEQARVPAEIDILRPGSFEALSRHLEDIRDTKGDGYYHIIHLDMHGALISYEQYQQLDEPRPPSSLTYKTGHGQNKVEPYEGKKAFIFFEDPESTPENNHGNAVSDDDLARLLNARQIPIAIINACQSAKQEASETSLASRLLEAGVQLVVAMGYSVTVSAAEKMMKQLYRQLLDGKEPSIAIRSARLELYNDKERRAAFSQQIELEDWMLPVVFQNTTPRLNQLRAKAQFDDETPRYSPPKTSYRFVGRDVDILNIESHLLNKRNLLLIRGMGGAGKTTLLHHLAWWWQKTRFVEQVFYFGYDVKAYSLQEIIQNIGAQLRLAITGRQDTDQRLVLHALRTDRHLLILDNMESITGEALAILNTLNQDQQSELKHFLQELVDAQSLVLMGSRSGEKWLKPAPLRDIDVYELEGLDYDAQSELSEAIIQSYDIPHYPSQQAHKDDFQRLLKLLGGYPLAIEVVLANLRNNTPGELIQQLQSANVNLDSQQETQDKTRSILKCIEYSHSNLSKDTQDLLFCFAPFTGVINSNFLESYTQELQKEEDLQYLPFNKWEQVIQEAARWGLIKNDEQFGGAGYLRFQPIFPYFLKTRLQHQENKKSAIDRAFGRCYLEVGKAIAQMMDSRESQQRQVGQLLAQLEYENLSSALQIQFKNIGEFWSLCDTISTFLNLNKAFDQQFKFCAWVYSFKEHYNSANSHQYDYDFLLALGNSGNAAQNAKDYAYAIYAHSEFLKVIDTVQGLDKEEINKGKATALHELGIVAQEQRDWAGAESYFKEALQIQIEFQDRHSQASTLHMLGIVAQKQRDWAGAESYFKEALQIYIEFQDRYEQAGTLHMLGIVAQEQRDWAGAESYFKEALQIKIEFQDRHSQASTLHMLGIVAQEQRDWAGAESYFKEALQIKIEFQDRHSQASTFGQLGRLAEEQEKWDEALEYSLQALERFVESQDNHHASIALRALSRLQDHIPDLTAKVAEALGVSIAESEELLEAVKGE